MFVRLLFRGNITPMSFSATLIFAVARADGPASRLFTSEEKLSRRRQDGVALCACKVLEMHLPRCLAEEVLTSQQTGDIIGAVIWISANCVRLPRQATESGCQQPPCQTLTLLNKPFKPDHCFTDGCDVYPMDVTAGPSSEPG